MRSSQTGKFVYARFNKCPWAYPRRTALGNSDLGLSRIEIVVATGNKASAKVAEKAGAKLEGILQNRILIHNHSHDALMYSLVTK